MFDFFKSKSKFSKIHTREEFLSTLDYALERVQKLIEVDPQYSLWSQFHKQLCFIKTFIIENKTATQNDKNKVSVGTLVVRELEPIEDIEIYKLGQALHEIQFYFQEHF